MARIRSIHPSLFTDEAFMTLTVEAPLAVTLLLGLWTEADDNGLFEWKPLTIKARLLPAPVVDIAPLLAILEAHRFILRYELDGRQYGAVRNFTKFQRPKKPNPIHPMTAEVRIWVGIGGEAVPNQFPTGGEIPPQMEDGGGRKEEDTPSLRSGAATSAADEGDDDEPEDLKARLFGTGLDWLAKHSGRKAAALRSVIGKWISEHGEAATLAAMMAAHQARNGPAFEPVSYITKTLSAPQQARASPDRFAPRVSASSIMQAFADDERHRHPDGPDRQANGHVLAALPYRDAEAGPILSGRPGRVLPADAAD